MADKKTGVLNVEGAVKAILDEFAGALPAQLEAAQKSAAKTAVKNLKAKSPKKSGEYSKGWKQTTEKTRTGCTTTIYNGNKPGLTHLLEFGHPILAGGRTVGQAKAFPHIADVETQALADYEAALQKEMAQ